MSTASDREALRKIMPGCAGAEPGAGNLSPQVDDGKPLWVLFASSGRSFFSRNSDILGTAAPTVTV